MNKVSINLTTHLTIQPPPLAKKKNPQIIEKTHVPHLPINIIITSFIGSKKEARDPQKAEVMIKMMMTRKMHQTGHQTHLL